MFKKDDIVICINEVRQVLKHKPLRITAGDEYIILESYMSHGVEMVRLKGITMTFDGEENVHIPYSANRFIIKNKNDESKTE